VKRDVRSNGISRISAGVLLLAILCLPGSAFARASTIYDMSRFLNEPHPFTVPHAQSAPVSPAPSAPGLLAELPEDDGYVPPAIEAEANDPIEPVNRFFFGFNELFYKYLLGPVARGYNAVTPEPVRGSVRNFLSNLKLPVVIVNDLLQGEVKRGLKATGRLVVNTTVGVAGLFDVAEKVGLEKHSEDFGQTLAVWGVGEGFYLVLPIFGPSNPRDAVGKLFVDGYFDPVSLYLENTDQDTISYVLMGVRGVTDYANVVEDLDRLREQSVDFYGTMRSLYRQRRAGEISNGREETAIPNIDIGIK